MTYGPPTRTVAQALANGAWMNAVRWLAEERDVDVQRAYTGAQTLD